MVFEEQRPKSNVIDLMAALEASVEKMGPDADSGPAAPEPAGPATAGPVPAGRGQPGRGRRRPRRAAAGPSPPQSGPPDLDALSKADLLARAAELDIPGRSKMSKPELIKAIQAAGRPKRRHPEDFLGSGRFPGNLSPAGPAGCDCRPAVIEQTRKEP